MRSVETKDLISALKPKLSGTKIETFSGIGTDTRKDLRGQLFWALKGEAFDAHDFLDKAIAQGATGLVVHKVPANLDVGNVAVFQVEDTLTALQALARYYRRQQAYRVLAITGSNGKTSTKEFAASLIAPERKLHWNPGSFNNHFGLPFNLIQAPADAQVVIAEMGMNHAGELATLCQIAEPDTVVCTMVGSGHIEHFGTVDKIAAAKEEIYKFSPSTALRIYNLDNSWTRKMWERASKEYPEAKIWTFSNQTDTPQVQVFLRALSMTGEGLEIEGRIGKVPGKVKVPVLGMHNALNLAAASTLALSLDIPAEKIWKNLEHCHAHWGRMQLLKNKNGSQILFDGYNANPESMTAMTEALKDIQTSGKRFAVLAQMKELGEASNEAHRKLGERISKLGLDKVWFYGPDAESFRQGFGENQKNLVISNNYEESLASEMVHVLDPNSLVVVKGSRGMETERFVLAAGALNFKKK